jgi:ligand-binding sensor domain-containing protein
MVGSESGGLSVIRDKKFTTLTTKDGLASDIVKAVYQDNAGAIWIGTNGGGLSVVKDGKVTSFTTNDGLSSNVVLSLFGDDKGTIWVGTPDGLNEFKNGHFKT